MKEGVSRDCEIDPSREWLVTNGLGGYASGTISGVITRRYHGYLVAALPAPFGRVVMLNELVESLELSDKRVYRLSGHRGATDSKTCDAAEFRLEFGLPVWSYQVDSITLEKRVVMPHGQNTVFVAYSLISGPETVRLALRPAINFRSHETPVSAELENSYTLIVGENRYEVSSGTELPPLRLMLYGENAALTVDRGREEISYPLEEKRGYPAEGELWSPGFFHVDLRTNSGAALVLSTQSWEDLRALSPAEAFHSESERKRRILSVAAKNFGRLLAISRSTIRRPSSWSGRPINF